MKKFLSILLTMAMVFSILPQGLLRVRADELPQSQETSETAVQTAAEHSDTDGTSEADETAEDAGTTGAVKTAEEEENEEGEESPLEIFEVVENITVFANFDGYLSSGEFWDNDLEEYVFAEYFYYSYSPTFHVKTLDGSIDVTGRDWQIELALQDAYGYACPSEVFDAETSQSFKNPWTEGNTYPVKYTLLGKEATMNVTVVGNPVESITADPIVLYEGSSRNTYLCSTTDENGVTTEWMQYNYQPVFTVNMKDGTQYKGDIYELANQMGHNIWVGYQDDQSAETPWGLGAHECKVTYLDYEGTFEVQIVEKPVASIEVTVDPVYADLDGYQSYYFESSSDGTYVEVPYTAYNWQNYITYEKITMTDGTVYQGTPSEVEDQTGEFWYVVTEPDPTCPWVIGDNAVSISYMGYEFPITVTLYDNPVQSIEIDPESVTFNEKCDRKGDEYWYDIETGEELDAPWYYYNLNNMKITVTLNDGTVYSGNLWEVQEQFGRGEWWEISHDQNWDNEWEIGEHPFTLTIYGKTIEGTAKVEPHPIKSVTFAPVVVTEGVDATWANTSWTDDDDHHEERWWWMYNTTIPSSMRVEMLDGTVYEGDPYEIVTGTFNEYFHHMDDQSFDNEWKAGEHKGTITLLGREYEYTVTILENPIVAVGASAIEFPGYAAVQEMSYFNHETGMWEQVNWKDYRISHVYTTELTFTYKDGHVESYDYWDLFFDENWQIEYTSDQSPRNEWGIGEHAFTMSVAGHHFEVPVIVLDNPIASISAEPVTVQEGSDVNSRTEYVDGQWMPYSYYELYPHKLIVHVELKDGSTFDGRLIDWNLYRDLQCSFISDQSYQNQWQAGQHEFTLKIAGFELTVPYTIVECPVQDITLVDTTIFEGTHGYLEAATVVAMQNVFLQNPYSVYALESLMYRVTYKDGTSEVKRGYDIEGIRYNVDGNYDEWKKWEIGTHSFTVYLGTIEKEMTLEIVEAGVESFTLHPYSVMENTRGYIGNRFDIFTGQFAEEMYFYDIYPIQATVVLTNGETCTGGLFEVGAFLEARGLELHTNHIQDRLPWEIGGNNYFTASAGDKIDRINVTIEESPVASMTADPIEILEGTNGFHGYDTQVVDGQEVIRFYDFMYYVPANAMFHLEMRDGSRVDMTYEELRQTYKLGSMYLEDQNGFELKAGNTYQCRVALLGQFIDIEVTVVPNHVVKVEVPDYEGMEFGKGFMLYMEDGEQFFHYMVYPSVYTVYYDDGSVKEFSREMDEWDELGLDDTVFYNGNQTAEDAWKAGETHTIQVSLFGHATSFDFTITENTVKSISVEDIVIPEYDEEIAHWFETENADDPWFVYSLYETVEVTVEYKDGTTETKTFIDWYKEYGYNYNYYYDDILLEDGYWVEGKTYPVTIELLGQKCVVNMTYGEGASETPQTPLDQVNAAAPNSWVEIEGKWYYKNATAAVVADWAQISGSWYYFDEEGVMVSGWQQIDGGWYYFANSMKTGWQQIGGTWYYFANTMTTGWKQISGVWYYFDNTGAMTTGWKQISGTWYYFENSGAMATGWKSISGSWYYFENSGAMVSGWKQISGKWYYFGNTMATGWKQVSGIWYYFGTDGAMKTGWVQVGQVWYYFDNSGAMSTNWKSISGKWYYFGGDGAMKTNWQKVDGGWYYFGSDGAMRSGWAQISGVWYYFDPANGSKMVSSKTMVIDGKSYTFDSTGAMK